jgi:hypothetical protein
MMKEVIPRENISMGYKPKREGNFRPKIMLPYFDPEILGGVVLVIHN